MKKALGYFILALPVVVIIMMAIDVGWKGFLVCVGAGAVATVLVWGCACLGHYLVTGGRKPEEKK